MLFLTIVVFLNLLIKYLVPGASTVGYSYSDIIRNYANIIFSGGNCAEDVQTHLEEHLKAIPGNNVSLSNNLSPISFYYKTARLN
jgi:hypothetical protein